nr:hypothetical protein CFP56_37322 [Quercus suber]
MSGSACVYFDEEWNIYVSFSSALQVVERRARGDSAPCLLPVALHGAWFQISSAARLFSRVESAIPCYSLFPRDARRHSGATMRQANSFENDSSSSASSSRTSSDGIYEDWRPSTIGLRCFSNSVCFSSPGGDEGDCEDSKFLAPGSWNDTTLPFEDDGTDYSPKDWLEPHLLIVALSAPCDFPRSIYSSGMQRTADTNPSCAANRVAGKRIRGGTLAFDTSPPTSNPVINVRSAQRARASMADQKYQSPHEKRRTTRTSLSEALRDLAIADDLLSKVGEKYDLTRDLNTEQLTELFAVLALVEPHKLPDETKRRLQEKVARSQSP